MQRHGAHELNEKWAQAYFAMSRLADSRQSRNEEGPGRPAAAPEALTIFSQTLLQKVIRKVCQVWGKGVNLLCVPAQFGKNTQAATIQAEERMDAGVQPMEQRFGSTTPGAPVFLRGSDHS
jgi:hypothetical protein